MIPAWLEKLFFVFFLGAMLHVNANSAPVGRIALLVGEAKIVDAGGRASPLRLGASVSEGDHIITAGDAIAIIVFMDEGRIALRADSELLIKQYKIDPTGTHTRLEFELVRGAIRQISGQAARQQPDRYRLNTPIASIGVRGTDFLTKITADALETFVQEGKIVVLSSSKDCLGSNQTGACAPRADLSATDPARYLKVLSDGKIEKRIVAAEEIEGLFGIKLAKISAAAPKPVPNKDTVAASSLGQPFALDMPAPDEYNKNVTTLLQPTNVPPQPPALQPAAPLQPPAPIAVTTPAPIAVATPAPIVVATPAVLPPVQVVNNTPDTSRQLVWGRFSSADQLPLQLLVPYDTAKDGRSVTVGELGQFALWRTGPKQTLPPTLIGEVQFAMRSGEAYYQQGTQVLPATITNPALSVNFDRSTFSSSLTVSQAQAGNVFLQVAGKMNDEGIFLGTSAGQRVAGAVSRDGQEAGYLFSRDHGAGVFKGVTLWNVR
jgi:hypothetical protein